MQKQKWEEKTKELHVWKLKDQKKKRKYRESDNREVKSRGGNDKRRKLEESSSSMWMGYGSISQRLKHLSVKIPSV